MYTNKDQLAIHKMPYYNKEKNWIEFDLNNFEKELVKNRVTIKRVDLVNKIQNVLKAKKYEGKHNNKSCVSWKIQGEPTDNNKIIWEGEAVVIDEIAKGEDE